MFIEHNFIYATAKRSGDVEKARVVQSSCSANKKPILNAELQICPWHTEAGVRVSVHSHGDIMAVVGQLHGVPRQVAKMDAPLWAQWALTWAQVQTYLRDVGGGEEG